MVNTEQRLIPIVEATYRKVLLPILHPSAGVSTRRVLGGTVVRNKIKLKRQGVVHAVLLHIRLIGRKVVVSGEHHSN